MWCGVVWCVVVCCDRSASLPLCHPQEEKKAKQDREDARSEAGSETGSRSGPKFDPKVTKVYKAVGTMLSKYRSGRIPKALKLLPHMQDWEELLLLTRPHNWTPHAMYQVCAAGFAR